MVAFLQRQTTFSLVTTWTEGNSPWKRSAFCWPTRSNTQRTFSCSGATMSVLPSIASTGSTMSVSRNHPAQMYAQTYVKYVHKQVFMVCVCVHQQVSAGSTSSYGRHSLTVLTAYPLLLLLMRRSSAAMEVRKLLQYSFPPLFEI